MIVQRQMMAGMDAATGRPLSGLDHLKQSVRDILTTRIGTRIMRRDYGSDLPNLVDKPMNDALKMQVYVTTVEALKKWEPRLEINRVQVQSVASSGQITVDIYGKIIETGASIVVPNVVV